MDSKDKKFKKLTIRLYAGMFLMFFMFIAGTIIFSNFLYIQQLEAFTSKGNGSVLTAADWNGLLNDFVRKDGDTMSGNLIVPDICIAGGGKCLSEVSSSGVQEFTSSGIFTVPSGVTSVLITLIGGGGGGGGASNATYTSPENGGGGGGAGVFVNQRPITVTPDEDITVTIGAGGPGGSLGCMDGSIGPGFTYNGSSGIDGGDTIFGSYFSVAGGSRGVLGGGNAPSGNVGGSGNSGGNTTYGGGGGGRSGGNICESGTSGTSPAVTSYGAGGGGGGSKGFQMCATRICGGAGADGIGGYLYVSW